MRQGAMVTPPASTVRSTAPSLGPKSPWEAPGNPTGRRGHRGGHSLHPQPHNYTPTQENHSKSSSKQQHRQLLRRGPPASLAQVSKRSSMSCSESRHTGEIRAPRNSEAVPQPEWGASRSGANHIEARRDWTGRHGSAAGRWGCTASPELTITT